MPTTYVQDLFQRQGWPLFGKTIPILKILRIFGSTTWTSITLRLGPVGCTEENVRRFT